MQLSLFATWGGGGDWPKGIRVAKRRDNIILDTTSSCTAVGMVEDAVELVGPDRIVYGSDKPLKEDFPTQNRRTITILLKY